MLLNLGGDYKNVNVLCNSTFSGLEGEDTRLPCLNLRTGQRGLSLLWSFTVKGLISPPRDIWQKWKNGEIKVIYTGKAVKEEIRGFINAVERDTEVPMNPMIALRDLKAI